MFRTASHRGARQEETRRARQRVVALGVSWFRPESISTIGLYLQIFRDTAVLEANKSVSNIRLTVVSQSDANADCAMF